MYELTIRAIVVGGDVSAIRAALHAIDEQAIVTFDCETHKVCVESSADPADIRIMLAALGYRIDGFERCRKVVAPLAKARGMPACS